VLQGAVIGFATLLLARAAVGVSEAAIGPASQSILSDLFPVSQRARAASAYALLLPVGIALGTAIGGWAREEFGWRRVLFAVGAIGLALAALVATTLPEPTRGYWDEGAGSHSREVSVRDSVSFLFGLPAFRHLIAGQVLAVFVFYSSAFGPAYLERSFDLTATQLGLFVAAMSLIGIPAMLLGGWISDRASSDSVRTPLLCVAAFNALAALSFAAYYLAWSRTSLVVIGLVGSLVPGSYGVLIATAQNLSPPAMRARAAALLSTIPAIVGGLGPPVAGALSDSLTPSLGREAMRYALLAIALPGYLGAALHFWLGARAVKRAG
jgi:MFS family permease